MFFKTVGALGVGMVAGASVCALQKYPTLSAACADAKLKFFSTDASKAITAPVEKSPELKSTETTNATGPNPFA